MQLLFMLRLCIIWIFLINIESNYSDPNINSDCMFYKSCLVCIDLSLDTIFNSYSDCHALFTMHIHKIMHKIMHDIAWEIQCICGASAL